ncbi:hypothetical protein B0I35DRAFT_234259 [Stachybotrys elegans]|uniref:Uncharacterized protein n=1 Tax=Stachybotrys elegans TaxID=80388 RepID=A0A8K0SXE5_9HYPO|nr:hypothetical protein B0I35DRAFT_234259 [Stachybotrys elegans]
MCMREGRWRSSMPLSLAGWVCLTLKHFSAVLICTAFYSPSRLLYAVKRTRTARRAYVRSCNSIRLPVQGGLLRAIMLRLKPTTISLTAMELEEYELHRQYVRTSRPRARRGAGTRRINQLGINSYHHDNPASRAYWYERPLDLHAQGMLHGCPVSSKPSSSVTNDHSGPSEAGGREGILQQDPVEEVRLSLERLSTLPPPFSTTRRSNQAPRSIAGQYTHSGPDTVPVRASQQDQTSPEVGQKRVLSSHYSDLTLPSQPSPVGIFRVPMSERNQRHRRRPQWTYNKSEYTIPSQYAGEDGDRDIAVYDDSVPAESQPQGSRGLPESRHQSRFGRMQDGGSV